MRVSPSDRDTVSFCHSQYHQIYSIFQCIICTEILVGELCGGKKKKEEEKKIYIRKTNLQGLTKQSAGVEQIHFLQSPQLIITTVTIIITNTAA